MIGSKLGPYELIEEIGRGGMATVYRGYQPNVDRFVAVKVIHRAVALDTTSLDRFTREAKLVAKLEHPHILPVYDYNGQSDPPYIVMRYLPTGTLKDILERTQLPFAEVGYLISQVASALDYAHRQGVVHRDIKPSNIMVDADGNGFLTDFGIARIVEGTQAQGLTASGMTIGTPGYMAPEQGLGLPLDGRADIYSLGVMLFEMLTGRQPYRAETPMAIILKHINDPVPEITTYNPNLPPALNAVVMRAMAKAPEDRYPTATEMARALTAALGTTSDITPAQLQLAAEQTILDLEKERRERSQTELGGATFVDVPGATPGGGQPPGGTVPGGRGTPASGSTVPSDSRQTAQRPAVVGAFAGAGLVLLLLLIGGGAFLFISGKNNSDATATAQAIAQAQIASTGTEGAHETLTATHRPSPTQPATATSTATATVTASSVPATATPTLAPPTATTPPPSKIAVAPTLVPTTNTPIPSPTVKPSATQVPPTETATAVPPTLVAPTIPPTPTVVPPTPTNTPGRMPYINDMESPNALDGWDYDHTAWGLKADSGNMAMVGSGDFHSLAVILAGQTPQWADPAATNVMISTKIYLDTPSSIARLIFRSSSGGYYAVQTAVGSLALTRGKGGDPTHILDERALRQQVAPTIVSGKWFQVEIWADPSRITVYIDHRWMFTADDTGDSLPGGAIMLQSYNKNFRTKYDDIIVQKPYDSSQHFKGASWPASWQRSDLNNTKLVTDNTGNTYVDLTGGNLSPALQPEANLRMSCRLWVAAGGFDMYLQESKAGQYFFHLEGGDLTLNQVDAAGKTVQQWTFPNFYGRADFFDLTVETAGDKLLIYRNGDLMTQTVKNPPPAGDIRFNVAPSSPNSPANELRMTDCLFSQTLLTPAEQATWAYDRIALVEARQPQNLRSDWYDNFDDQFRTKDWWIGGVNAPGQFKVNSADNVHTTYLEIAYKDGAAWRMFRNEPALFLVFGSGTDKVTFKDSSDIYLRANVRLINAGTAWIAARTTPSLGGGTLNGYRIELTKAIDGSYSIKARIYALEAATVYFQGVLPTIPGAVPSAWTQLLIIAYQGNVAFFANGRFLANVSNATILNGSIALGVEQGSTADFDQMQLREVDPTRTHFG